MDLIAWALIAAGGAVFLVVIGVMMWSLMAKGDLIDSSDD
jgi:hypothetical protein